MRTPLLHESLKRLDYLVKQKSHAWSLAYYRVQTARVLENIRLSGLRINHYPGFVEAWAIVKLAAARANTDVWAMRPDRLAAIEKAPNEVLVGKSRFDLRGGSPFFSGTYIASTLINTLCSQN